MACTGNINSEGERYYGYEMKITNFRSLQKEIRVVHLNYIELKNLYGCPILINLGVVAASRMCCFGPEVEIMAN